LSFDVFYFRRLFLRPFVSVPFVTDPHILWYIFINWVKNISAKMCSVPPPGEKLTNILYKQAYRPLPVCVHILRILAGFLKRTCRLGFCLVNTFNGYIEKRA
jgi:hypothetical protein